MSLNMTKDTFPCGVPHVMCNAYVSSRSGIKSDDYCDACGENCIVVLGCILIF